MSRSGPVRYKFESVLREKSIQRLLDLLCSDNPVVKTADRGAVADAVYALHFIVANHPDLCAEDPVASLMDSDDWIGTLPATVHRDCHELRAFLKDVIAPANALFIAKVTTPETKSPAEPDSESTSEAPESQSTDTDASVAESKPAVESRLKAPPVKVDRSHVTMLAFGIVTLLSSVCSLATALYLERCHEAK